MHRLHRALLRWATGKDPRGARVDPREVKWLPVVTGLVCVAEGALVTLLLLVLRDGLFQLTSWLSVATVGTLGFAVQSGETLLVRAEQFWMAAIVTAVVFVLFGVLIAARKATWNYLESTYTTTGPFLRRKADTLERLDGLLSEELNVRS